VKAPVFTGSFSFPSLVIVNFFDSSEARRIKPPASKNEQDMKTNVPIQKQRIETKTQPPDIQRRINAGWLKLWRAVYPNTPPPTKVQNPNSKIQRPTEQLPAAARRDLDRVTPPVTAVTRFVDLYGVT
jgi:hypothetical protein